MNPSQTSVPSALGMAHVILLDDLKKLREAAGSAAGMRLNDLRGRLGETRQHVAEHFRLEEQNGYLDTVKRQGPGQERLIQELVEEHRRLEQSLVALIEEARVATEWEDLGKKVLAWVNQVRRHELRENELVQDAFNLDLAAED